MCTKEIIPDGQHDSGMFMTLFKYITGANAESENIDMTTPVSTKWTRIDAESSEHEMCFYLNKAHQENPPKPTNANVFIENRPEMTIYTR